MNQKIIDVWKIKNKLNIWKRKIRFDFEFNRKFVNMNDIKTNWKACRWRQYYISEWISLKMKKWYFIQYIYEQVNIYIKFRKLIKITMRAFIFTTNEFIFVKWNFFLLKIIRKWKNNIKIFEFDQLYSVENAIMKRKKLDNSCRMKKKMFRKRKIILFNKINILNEQNVDVYIVFCRYNRFYTYIHFSSKWFSFLQKIVNLFFQTFFVKKSLINKKNKNKIVTFILNRQILTNLSTSTRLRKLTQFLLISIAHLSMKRFISHRRLNRNRLWKSIQRRIIFSKILRLKKNSAKLRFFTCSILNFIVMIITFSMMFEFLSFVNSEYWCFFFINIFVFSIRRYLNQNNKRLIYEHLRPNKIDKKRKKCEWKNAFEHCCRSANAISKIA